MVESDWNMALATLYSIRQGMDRCNDAMHGGNFVDWLKGIYHFFGELSPFMSNDDSAEVLGLIDELKGFRNRDFDSNLHKFFLVTMKLRREAHRHKLLIKEAEDTSKHGGT